MSSFEKKFNSIKIPLADIKTATNNFGDENLIRQGGFGKIYKGRLLRSGKLINIVARMFDDKHGHGTKEFRMEIMMLSSLKHHNLVSIVGFCDENDVKIIINKLEAKGSLDQHLSDPTLSWTRRLQICVGIARALSYIHYDERRNFSVIHRNVKSSKILLDDKWEAKLSGFELSVMQPAARRLRLVLDSFLCGTYAYIDPAYVTSGGVTHKSDVYSLGVVLFEVLCGRKALISDKHELDAMFKAEGRSDQLTKKHSSEGKLDEHEGQLGPPSTLLQSNLLPEKPPSYGTLIKAMQSSNKLSAEMQPPSDSFGHIGSYFSEEQYMITMRNLEPLHIPEEKLLAKLAKYHYEEGKLDDIIHPGLQKQMDSQSLRKFSEAAYCCLNEQRAQRPNIDRIVSALEQALELQLAHENTEHSTIAVERTANHWEGKLEHLKIGLDAIKLATENFAEKYFIGSGGYGWVYKAELEHFDPSSMKHHNESELPKRRSTVAIKYILIREDTQGEQGFIAEIETLSSCKHPNIVSLLGFCYEHPHMILVYEHVSNGSLDDYLGSKGKMTNLTWVQRLKICIDIARGLDYIHTTTDHKEKIIHRDIKSANILLGENWEAKIADFGLSKFHPLNHTASTLNTNKVVGTKVYWDPEYESTGRLKKESDVYSFGVVLFEILSGRLAYDQVYTKDNEKGLAPIARQHFENGTLKEMVDPMLNEESDEKAFTLSKGPNQDSLHTFSKIAYQCLAETQAQRPTMKVVIKELEKALNFQETHKDSFRLSFEDIRLATQNFNDKNFIGSGGFGKVYRGEVLSANGPTTIAVKWWENNGFQGEDRFLSELEILFEYKNDKIIGFLGYCDENNEKIIVYEYASNGSLDRHVKEASLTWTKRLKISIDVAIGLDFLHGGGSTQDSVIHRDIKTSNILLNEEWKAKISDFGLAIITPIDKEIDFVVDAAWGTRGYIDPLYYEWNFLTRESDIYSLGVVLFEMMCGRISFQDESEDDHQYLVDMAKCCYEDGKLDELVFEGIKDKIVPNSLTTFQTIAYQCLHDEREGRPTAGEVVLQLKKALEFQEDHEIWEAKLPRDYSKIIYMSKTPDIYSNVSKRDLYNMFCKGILLQEGKVCFSLNCNGERNEMVSATMFSYENHVSHKWRSIKKSRFQRVMKMMDVSNLKIQIKIKTQFLCPNVIYGAHLVFKFCDPRKFSSQPMYVNLKYKMGTKTLHAYFATWREDEWMMIELCRFLPLKKDVDFEVQLESLSRYYCGSGAIYVEGIDFRAIDYATLKVKPEAHEKLNSDSVQQVTVDYDEITQLDQGEKLFSLSTADGKKCHMLPAKMVLYDSPNVKCFNWKSLADSRFAEAAELLSHQIFRIKCKIETQKLSSETDYACYLVFKLSQKCHGLQCPVKVQDVLLRKNIETKFLYFRSPSSINLHGNLRVPKHREDGLMEVIVWEFNSGNNLSVDHLPMNLKLRCYEGTMCGLIVYGIELRPI